MMKKSINEIIFTHLGYSGLSNFGFEGSSFSAILFSPTILLARHGCRAIANILKEEILAYSP